MILIKILACNGTQSTSRPCAEVSFLEKFLRIGFLKDTWERLFWVCYIKQHLHLNVFTSAFLILQFVQKIIFRNVLRSLFMDGVHYLKVIESLRRGSLLFTIQFLGVPGTQMSTFLIIHSTTSRLLWWMGFS